jgi:hypothetical protein
MRTDYQTGRTCTNRLMPIDPRRIEVIDDVAVRGSCRQIVEMGFAHAHRGRNSWSRRLRDSPCGSIVSG